MAEIEVIVPPPAIIEVVEVDHVVVEVLEAGAPGPPGGTSFVFTQSTPLTVWTVNHNLGRFPLIRLKTLGTAEIEGQIAHVSANQFTVTFNTAQAGQALYI